MNQSKYGLGPALGPSVPALRRNRLCEVRHLHRTLLPRVLCADHPHLIAKSGRAVTLAACHDGSSSCSNAVKFAVRVFVRCKCALLCECEHTDPGSLRPRTTILCTTCIHVAPTMSRVSVDHSSPRTRTRVIEAFDAAKKHIRVISQTPTSGVLPHDRYKSFPCSPISRSELSKAMAGRGNTCTACSCRQFLPTNSLHGDHIMRQV